MGAVEHVRDRLARSLEVGRLDRRDLVGLVLSPRPEGQGEEVTTRLEPIGRKVAVIPSKPLSACRVKTSRCASGESRKGDSRATHSRAAVPAERKERMEACLPPRSSSRCPPRSSSSRRSPSTARPNRSCPGLAGQGGARDYPSRCQGRPQLGAVAQGVPGAQDGCGVVRSSVQLPVRAAVSGFEGSDSLLQGVPLDGLEQHTREDAEAVADVDGEPPGPHGVEGVR